MIDISFFSNRFHGFNNQLDDEFTDRQEVDYDSTQRDSRYDFRGQQQIGREFGGQQQANYEFGGQQQTNYEFGGQQQTNYEFGGQQQVDYDFGGQQQMRHDFGGHRQMGHEFGGHRQMGHEFGGQQPMDDDDDFLNQQEINSVSNNKVERLNMGGYSELGQRPVDYEDEIEQQISQKHTNFQEQSHRTRQEEGKEEFDKDFTKGGYKKTEEENTKGVS